MRAKEKKTVNLKKGMTEKLFSAAQWSWGLPQTLLGAGLYLRHRGDRHFNYNGTRVTVWNRPSGISLGKFIFVPRKKEDVDSFVLSHEYGHALQSLILGPAYLPLIGIPSLLWNRLPYFERKRQNTGKSYYSAVFERTANQLAERRKK